jgi:hypothetical protein
MPLRDHFHPPLSTRKSWEAIHGGWAFVMAQRLNAAILPKGFESEQQVHRGTSVEIDVATYEDDRNLGAFAPNGTNGGIATLPRTYAPPAPPIRGEVSFTDPDLFEVQIYKDDGGWKLVAAVELISPSNKDRKSHRRSFATKVASYLQKGVSVATVDVVTSRQANLHESLVELLDLNGEFDWHSPAGLSAIAYRVAREEEKIHLEVWPFPLTLGDDLPTIPLWIEPNHAVPLELELTYTTAYSALIKSD